MLNRRVASLVLLAAAALLAAACGGLTTKLAYSNAALAYRNLPPMLAWMVDDYVDVHGPQKEWVRDRIDRMMEWHRTHELPEYRRFLERVLAETNEPFTVAEVSGAYVELRGHYRRAVERALPDIAEFMMQMDPEQAAQMEKKLAKDNRQLAKEATKGSAEERHERRVKRFLEHVDNWLGSVTPAQRELVESHYRGLPDLNEERLADRKVRQAQTLALIRSRGGREQTVAGLRRLLLETDSWRNPDYVRKLDQRDKRFFEMFAALSGTFTPEQRRHLQGRIRGFMKDINNLTAGGPIGPG